MDVAARRARIGYPEGLFVNYDYDLTGNVTRIRENGATSGVGVLATYAYDALGRRSSVTFGNGSVQSFTYDAASRLAGLTNNLGGAATTHDLTQSFTFSPASQIIGQTRSNDVYAWTAHFNVNRPYGTNGLNQLTSAGGQSISHDARGNLTGDGVNSYSYNSVNQLMVHSGGGIINTLYYEPSSGMLSSINANAGPNMIDTRFAWSGPELLLERSGSSGTILRRYVHGAGFDNFNLVWGLLQMRPQSRKRGWPIRIVFAPIMKRCAAFTIPICSTRRRSEPPILTKPAVAVRVGQRIVGPASLRIHARTCWARPTSSETLPSSLSRARVQSQSG